MDTNSPTTLPAPAAQPAEVWVAVVDHRHGSNVTVADTREAGFAVIHEFVTEWWPTEMGPDETIPEDPQEAIDAYFEHVDDESYTLTASSVMTSRPAAVSPAAPASTLWIATITTDEGEEQTYTASREGAVAAVHRFVTEWWPREMHPDDRLPEDPQQAIDAYFAVVEDESYTIEPAALLP